MFEALSTLERETLRRALDASVNGPFFPDWEFQTLFGIDRSEAAASLRRFPDLSADNEVDRLAVYNSIANLLGYPHGGWPELHKRGLNADDLRAASRTLRGNDDVSIQ